MKTMTARSEATKVKTRFLIISDTHSASPAVKYDGYRATPRQPLPKADVLLHCGDLTMLGHLIEYQKTLEMLQSIEADLKLVIAGNHDITLDEEYYARRGQYMHSRTPTGHDPELPLKAKEMWLGGRAKAAGVTYLEEGTHSFTLNNGAKLRVYASPYQPEFCGWAFPYWRNEDRYNAAHQCTPNAAPVAENPVPDFPAIDVMMTHGPPMGVLDRATTGDNVGCEHLLRAAHRCKPRLHCFGHIHEGWGARRVKWNEGKEPDVKSDEHVSISEDVPVEINDDSNSNAAQVDISKGGKMEVIYGQETLMVNASIMTVTYKPWNKPWLIDMDLDKAD